MSYLTRDLLSHSIARNAGELVTLKIKSYESNDDGSFISTIQDLEIFARVVDLQPREIQRLQDKGLTIHKGVSIAVAQELEKCPDQIIRASGEILKIIDFTISENGSVFIADVPAMGEATE